MAQKNADSNSSDNQEIHHQEGDKETILVVDDDVSIVEGWKVTLENLGYNVEAFSDGREALREFRKNPSRYDLVITDQNMPGLRGDELIQELRGVAPCLPIILISGVTYKVSPETRSALRINAVLRKPLEAKILEQAIRAVLSESKLRPDSKQ